MKVQHYTPSHSYPHYIPIEGLSFHVSLSLPRAGPARRSGGGATAGRSKRMSTGEIPWGYHEGDVMEIFKILKVHMYIS